MSSKERQSSHASTYPKGDEQERQTEAQAVEEREQRTFSRSRPVGEGEELYGGEGGADTGRPAQPEGKAEQRRPPHRPVGALAWSFMSL